MKKIIKNWGEVLIITFNPEDRKIYDLKKGDIVDIELTNLKKDGDKPRI